METVLIVDDEKNYLLILETLLTKEGLQVLTAGSGLEALARLREAEADLVLTDMKMPGLDGLELLSAIKEQEADLPVIVMTAFGTVDKAVEAMKRGAFDYLTKPFENRQLLVTVSKALELSKLVRQNRLLQTQVAERYGMDNVVGNSKQMRDVYGLVEKVAPAKATVLITGESGTGKELIARAIHLNSDRAKRPFISVNCAALTETLLESELFGHEKGAFTGAATARKGRFELADGGTLFLDEIGHTSPALQVKLLRVLESKTVERVGDHTPISVDFRLITATHRDLREMMDRDSFREDLFYRINVIPMEVPPLRQRREDIPVLAQAFVNELRERTGRPLEGFTPAAMSRLHGHSWPGNVRELKNAVEYAFVLCREGLIDRAHLPQWAAGDQEPPPRAGRAEDQKRLLESVLAETGGNQSEAARRLGVSRMTIYNRIKRFGLDLDGLKTG